MKITTSKSPLSQQWEKKLFPNQHEMENAGEKQCQGGWQHSWENGDLGGTGRVKPSPQLPKLQHQA